MVMVEELDTVRACHRLAAAGFMLGGSTGTVVHGATSWLADHDAQDLTAVAISPDMAVPIWTPSTTLTGCTIISGPQRWHPPI